MTKFKNQREMFYWVWQNHERKCTNCSIYLGTEPRAHYFDHKISKGARPDLKLESDNCRLLCLPCHTARHDNPVEFRRRRR